MQGINMGLYFPITVAGITSLLVPEYYEIERCSLIIFSLVYFIMFKSINKVWNQGEEVLFLEDYIKIITNVIEEDWIFSLPFSCNKKSLKPAYLLSLGLTVDRQGLEPWTPWLRVRCSTSWASGPFFVLSFNEYSTRYKKMQHFFWKNSKIFLFIDFQTKCNPHISLRLHSL